MFERIMEEEGQGAPGEYPLSYQIGGIFIILFAGFLGMVVSFAVYKLALKPSWVLLILLFKGIGCGVIISIACIHLINETFEDFDDSIEDGLLPDFEAWPWVFVQIAFLLMSLIDFSIGRKFAQIEHPGKKFDLKSLVDFDDGHHHHHQKEDMHTDQENGVNQDNGANQDEFAITDKGNKLPSKSEKVQASINLSATRENGLVAEFSIMVHSILVGFALGMQPTKGEWQTLLIALVVHQFFEGFGLAQIVESAKYEKAWKKWLVVLFFSLTCPVGIAIGIGVAEAEGSETPQSALFLAVLNAFCGGLLLYLGLVNLLTSWFSKNVNLQLAPAVYFITGYIGVTIGLTIMTVLSLWA